MPETKPFNLDTPNWQPLERALALAGIAPNDAANFMWMGEWTEGSHQYKHRDTRNYAILRADSSPDTCRAELENALSTGRTWGKAFDVAGRGAVLILLLCGSYKVAVHQTSASLTFDGFTFELPNRTDGDCARRLNCYQDGQLMLNLHGKTAWINTDTDDIPGLGERTACRRPRPTGGREEVSR